MNVAKEIKKIIAGFPDDYVFTASDFDFAPQSQAAVVKSLNRMAKSGEISKLAKGKFYKPRKTQFGILKPSAYQIAKDFIERDGKIIGYITGYSAYNALGLTTQISSYIQIGVNKYRQSVKREEYYWITRSLKLMAQNPNAERAIFKGGTSLSKAHSIGNRFSEDIDIAINDADTLTGNQLKMLIKHCQRDD